MLVKTINVTTENGTKRKVEIYKLNKDEYTYKISDYTESEWKVILEYNRGLTKKAIEYMFSTILETEGGKRA